MTCFFLPADLARLDRRIAEVEDYIRLLELRPDLALPPTSVGTETE